MIEMLAYEYGSSECVARIAHHDQIKKIVKGENEWKRHMFFSTFMSYSGDYVDFSPRTSYFSY